MNYLILAETEFFALINGAGNGNNMEAAYNGFVESVISLCYGNGNSADAAIAMAYAENELQHHHTLYEDSENSVNLFVRKALSFIRKMQKHAAADHIQVPPLSAIRTSTNNTTENPASPLQWTGNAIDLVELIYGIDEMGCINNGNMPLKQLAPLLYKIFGVESKDCYRFYTAVSYTHLRAHETSNAGRTKAALISLTGCRRNSTERFCVTRSWNG